MDDSEKTKAQLIAELQALREEKARLNVTAELHHREEKFRAVFELSPDAIFLANATTGLIVDANPATTKLLERPLEQVIGTHHTALHPADQLVLAQQAFDYRPVPGQDAPAIEIEVVCAGNRLKPVEIRGRAITLAGGEYVLGTFRDISERKQAEAQISQNRRQLRALLDAAPDSMLLIKPDGEIIACNQTVSSRFGRDCQTLIGTNTYNLVSPEVAEFRRAKAQTVLDTGQPVQFEDERNGRIIHNVVNPVLNADGQVQSLAIFWADITNRRQAEAALRESEKRLNLVLEATSEGVWDWKFESGEVYFSPAWKRSLGFGDDEVRHHVSFWESVVHPDDMPRVQEALRLHFEGQTAIYECENRLRLKSGEWRWNLDRGKVVAWDAAGKPLRMVGTDTDITERRQAESALRESEEFNRTLLSNISDSVFVTDDQGVFTYVCPNVDHNFGFTQAEVSELGNINQLLGAGLFDPAQLAARHELSNIEWTAVIKGGETRSFLITVKRIDLRGGTVLYVCRNITDSVRLTAENEQLQKQFFQVQKMESIGQLAGGVAHDFNNLLVPIIGYAELGLAITPEDHKLHNSLLQIKKAGDRAANLTRQILAFSRQQVLEMRILDLNEVITDFKKMLQRLIGEDVLLQTELTSPIYRIKADQGQLEQVLLNLAVNARDAMPNGGKLTIKTDNVLLDESYAAKHPDVQPGPHVKLVITDTGHGMDVATQERIFEPFFTTKARGQGTGLGLATVFGIVRQHEGTIWVDSQIERGTKFKIYLPAAETTTPNITPDRPDTDSLQGIETVLVVEDEASVRRLVCYTLRSHGYHVLEADGPETGLAVAATYNEPIDLLLADVIMPDMDGLAFYNQLVRERPGLKVLYMSGYTNQVIAQHGVLDKGVDLLQKPFAIRDLLSRVRTALA